MNTKLKGLLLGGFAILAVAGVVIGVRGIPAKAASTPQSQLEATQQQAVETVEKGTESNSAKEKDTDNVQQEQQGNHQDQNEVNETPGK